MTRRKWIGLGIGMLLFGGAAYMGSSAQCGLWRTPADSDLIRACETGDVALAVRALRWGANPNANQVVYRNVPLGEAAEGGHAEVIRLLLRAGAHVNAPYGGWHYKPPLVWAAMNGHLEAVRVLLDGGADIHATSCENETALELAAKYNHPAVVKLLKQRGARQ